jgi:hypothetical protein
VPPALPCRVVPCPPPCRLQGVVYAGREDLTPDNYLSEVAVATDKRTLAEAIDGADVFLGLSVSRLGCGWLGSDAACTQLAVLLVPRRSAQTAERDKTLFCLSPCVPHIRATTTTTTARLATCSSQRCCCPWRATLSCLRAPTRCPRSTQTQVWRVFGSVCVCVCCGGTHPRRLLLWLAQPPSFILRTCLPVCAPCTPPLHTHAHTHTHARACTHARTHARTHTHTAAATRPDVIMATGRSDFPNQVNNVIAFPPLFRGALDCRAR